MTPLTLFLVFALQIPPDHRPCDVCRQAETFAFRDEEPEQALTVFRRALREGSPTPKLWGEYGVLASYLEPGETRDGALIRQAEEALEQALAAEPDHPRWLFAYAFLSWKRGLLPQDVVREIEGLLRPWADDRGELGRELTPSERAGLYAARAEALGLLGSDRGHGLTWIRPSSGRGGCWLGREYRCAPLTAAMAAPEHLQRLSEPASGDREARFRALESAFELTPGWRRVARGYLGELARRGRWGGFEQAASRYERAGDEPGWAVAFRAAARWRRGYPAQADSLFDRALERLSDRERAALLEVSQSVTPENEERYLQGDPENREAWSRFLLRISDPLFITPVNERRLEHFTRVVLAELWFDDEETRGSRTARGEILVRYGEPYWVWESGRPGHLPGTAAEVEGPIQMVPGKRRIFWRYGEGRPEFLFQRDFRSLTAQHTGRSANQASRFRGIEPSTFDFPVQPMPHQRVRFKGRDTDAEVDYYTSLPPDSVSEQSPAVETGLFFLPRSLHEELIDLRRAVWLIPEPLYLTFRAPLNRGQYVYSFEALSEDGRVRRASRSILEVQAFPADRVSVSDILVARRIGPTDREVRNRWDLEIQPAARLTFGLHETVAIYFEVYGLQAARGDQSGYTIDIEVESAEGRSIFGRILEGIKGVVTRGDEKGSTLSWQRTASPNLERIPEWFEIDMSWPGPGAYRLTVTVTDLVSGVEATAVREIEIVGPGA